MFFLLKNQSFKIDRNHQTYAPSSNPEYWLACSMRSDGGERAKN